ncbi:UDP-N-acetylmuramoyl-L-alanyl-D-glutamate--2,6-diaminopimelate ligase [Colwelliaceae bacterium MEBiC 14330]
MPKPATQMIIASLKQFAITLPDWVDFTNSVGDLQNDSRAVKQGDIFCAIIGHQQDGRNYIEKAIINGAKLVLTECENSNQHGKIEQASGVDNIVMVSFYQLNSHLFNLAKSYYQQPQDAMNIIGITGTNGKTTTSQLLAQMLTNAAMPCAIIGTNGAGSLENLAPVENTTPSALELHQLFNRFRDDSFSHVAMEVSSHALSQKRVLASLFDIALFTNLSRDHLDYHGSMTSYAAAKKQIFTGNNNQIAIVNYDDKQGQNWLKNWPKSQVVWLYGREEGIKSYQYYITAENISHHEYGVAFTLVTHLGEIDINSALLGDFNVDNLLAAISVLLLKGIELAAIKTLVKQLSATAGRMEATSAKNAATAVVDYAHTPDALEKALKACKQHCAGKLFVVFGCGGDRDKGKRPLMAQVAEKYADYIVVTNDNPRSENAQSIANDIVAGFTYAQSDNIKIILERKSAVIETLSRAKGGDIVLLAGKGHEDYVIVPKYDESGVMIGTQKLVYDERKIVADFYKQYNSSAAQSNEATL